MTLRPAKAKLKERTACGQGRNIRKVMENGRICIRGWLGCFGIAGMDSGEKSKGILPMCLLIADTAVFRHGSRNGTHGGVRGQLLN